MRLAIIIACTLWAMMVGIVPGLADKRVALVVGNDRYANLPPDQQLQKAANDARAIGDTVERLRFEVIRGENLGRQALFDKLDVLTQKLSEGDTAFFFFAGHGVALGGANYILPSDVPNVEPGQDTRLKGAALGEYDIIAALKERGARIIVVVLDACRNNPFKREGGRGVGTGRGFIRSEPVRGVFSLYSAGIGQTALDRLSNRDPNPNSVFTRVLLPALAKPGLHLGDLAIEVREQVAQLADTIGHEQRPAYYDETIGGRIYLAGLPPAVSVGGNASASPPAVDPATAWAVVKDTKNIAELDAFIRRFGGSFFGDLARLRIDELKKLQTATVAPPIAPAVPPRLDVPTPVMISPPVVPPSSSDPCAGPVTVSFPSRCNSPLSEAPKWSWCRQAASPWAKRDDSTTKARSTG
jgi:hypothetical protein